MAGASEAQRRWQLQRRADLDRLKLSHGGCVDCGYNKHPSALHWDHVRGVKQGATRKAFEVNWAWERILAEIAKCDLVCANCHAIRTSARGDTVQNRGAVRLPVVPGEFGSRRWDDDRPKRHIAESHPRRADYATHCKNGRAYTSETTYVGADGRKICRTCDAARKRAAWVARKAS